MARVSRYPFLVTMFKPKTVFLSKRTIFKKKETIYFSNRKKNYDGLLLSDIRLHIGCHCFYVGRCPTSEPAILRTRQAVSFRNRQERGDLVSKKSWFLKNEKLCIHIFQQICPQ